MSATGFTPIPPIDPRFEHAGLVVMRGSLKKPLTEHEDLDRCSPSFLGYAMLSMIEGSPTRTAFAFAPSFLDNYLAYAIKSKANAVDPLEVLTVGSYASLIVIGSTITKNRWGDVRGDATIGVLDDSLTRMISGRYSAYVFSREGLAQLVERRRGRVVSTSPSPTPPPEP